MPGQKCDRPPGDFLRLHRAMGILTASRSVCVPLNEGDGGSSGRTKSMFDRACHPVGKLFACQNSPLDEFSPQFINVHRRMSYCFRLARHAVAHNEQ
ncbi:hypothetical protein KCP69_12620 [Salmonella enterica subsp. enterica]|nr:hypothetical protein KCP69_12620 [Salmonella enterica subsp. enterica]